MPTRSQQGIRPLVAAAAAWQGPTSTLTHRWQMDSGSISGGVVHDLVGTLDATIVGAPVNVASPPGAFASTGLSFDGVSDQLNLASNPITLGSAFTVAFWINLSDITYVPDGAGTDPRFFDFGSIGQFAIVTNLSGTTPAGQLNINTNYGPGGTDTNGAVLSNNTWAHLAFTLTGSTFAIYVNGSAVSQTANTGDTGDGTNSRIACRGDNLRHTKGLFYQFVTYSSALSPTDVTTLYNAK